VQEDGGDDVGAVGEDICFDDDVFAESCLRREAPLIDFRGHGFNDNAAQAGVTEVRLRAAAAGGGERRFGGLNHLCAASVLPKPQIR
jgi:hypothetical protein